MPGLRGICNNSALRALIAMSTCAAVANSARGALVGLPSGDQSAGQALPSAASKQVRFGDSFTLRDFTAYMPPAPGEGESLRPTIIGDHAPDPAPVHPALPLPTDGPTQAQMGIAAPLAQPEPPPAAKAGQPRLSPPQSIAIVPEPSCLGLLAIGGLALLSRQRRHD